MSQHEVKTSILDNELIQKYFFCDASEMLKTKDYHAHHLCEEASALRILKAMEQPIRSGDRILVYSEEGQEWREDFPHPLPISFHPYTLRLPDQFQPKKECCSGHPDCPNNKEPDPVPPSSEVEDDMKDILVAINEGIYTDIYFEKRLRKLVELVRKESR